MSYARKQPNVNPKKVALVGFSLGAYLSLSVAVKPDLQLAAVIDFAGGLTKEMRKGVKKLPPTLILHGAADDKVPVAEAHGLSDLLSTLGVDHEIKIYKDEGHACPKSLKSLFGQPFSRI